MFKLEEKNGSGAPANSQVSVSSVIPDAKDKLFKNYTGNVPEINVGGVEDILCVKKSISLPSNLVVNNEAQLNVLGAKDAEVVFDGTSNARVTCGGSVSNTTQVNLNKGKKVVMNYCVFKNNRGLYINKLKNGQNDLRNLTFD